MAAGIHTTDRTTMLAVAEAATWMQAVGVSLSAIDLRTVRDPDLRALIKGMRELADAMPSIGPVAERALGSRWPHVPPKRANPQRLTDHLVNALSAAQRIRAARVGRRAL